VEVELVEAGKGLIIKNVRWTITDKFSHLTFWY